MFLQDPGKTVLRKKANGFSTIELAVVMSMVLAISGIALPSISNNLRAYQLNSVAGMVADQFKITRFVAIRQNVPVTCYVTPNSPGYQLWTDAAGTGAYAPTDNTTTLSGSQTLVESDSIPDEAGLESALGVTGTTTLSGSSSQVSLTFDSRGAVTGSTAVNVLYIGYPGNPSYGYRAVVVLPSGSVQIWTPEGDGTWVQTN